MGYAQVSGLNHLNDQINIMALVGNGFDIQILREYEQTTTTRYADFYHFMKMKNVDDGNLIVGEMESALKKGRENWSDIEECIASLEAAREPIAEIRRSLDEVREHFSEFLNMVVSTSLLAEVSSDAQSNRWGRASLSKFLKDIESREDLERIPFGLKKANYDLYNFYFVNFNYTSLLDNYLYMDSEQFDPVPYSTVDTNFTFEADPRGLALDKWDYASSSYVEMQVAHPHGYQDIPRSLLFGTNGDGDPRSPGAKLAKTYWARVEQRYAHLFDDTSLFIVFGCSLGKTDEWWWKNIADALLKDEKRALLLYWWNADSSSKLAEDDVRRKFLKAAGLKRAERDAISEQIVVISYADSDDRTWLNSRR